MEKKCMYCQEDLLYKNQKICKKKECKNLHSKFLYHQNKIDVKCNNCNIIFLGKRKEHLCNNCKIYSAEIRKKGLKKVEKEIICRKCEKSLGFDYFYNNKSNKIKKSINVCEDCKIENSLIRSKNLKGENNPNFQGKSTKKKLLIEKIKRRKYEKKSLEQKKLSSEKKSKFMKLKNPMFKSKTRDKVRKTIKKKIKNKELIYKTGSDHHSWKGNRPNDKIIRTRLKWWRKESLEKSNFTCSKCNKKGGFLEVHHIFPLRDIIKNAINNEEKKLSDYIVETEEFEQLINLICDFHKNNDIGLVLCKTCHSEEDEYRKI